MTAKVKVPVKEYVYEVEDHLGQITNGIVLAPNGEEALNTIIIAAGSEFLSIKMMNCLGIRGDMMEVEVEAKGHNE